jgi:pimeloyl-ACP methyl ester carboxylesterase
VHYRFKSASSILLNLSQTESNIGSNGHPMKITDKFFRIAVAMMAFVIGGCSSGRNPLKTFTYPSAAEKSKHLIVFLRGMGGAWGCLMKPHACFETLGFVETVRRKKLPFDMVAPDLNFSYYEKRTLVERLTQDVIQPARAGGYDKIWLAGVSMGGLGAILYSQKAAEPVDGILLLGPYLGERAILTEISKAGGLKYWNPGPYDEEKDWQRMVWDWLKKAGENPAETIPLYLGVGLDDLFYEGQKLLADALPPENVIAVSGGHRLSTFKKIWDIFLDSNRLNQP